MNIPKNLFYTKDHEWVKIEGDIATIGITYHASDSLGDVVYVDVTTLGDNLSSPLPHFLAAKAALYLGSSSSHSREQN